MAFHVACSITCRKICFCSLGLPERLRSGKGKNAFLEEVARVEQFLNDPWLIKSKEDATIQVKVPKVVVSPAVAQFPVGEGGEGDETAAASALVKRAALQKQAAAASLVAEDYASRFESGDLADDGEEQGNSNAKVLCRLCFSGENEGSERSRKMLPCNSCGKKYHRRCVKVWSQNRDLFHWSSWVCPSCRTCEVCRRSGDPNKFMFCKRCDGAYHCYCQQPPHKNVGHGPYLCPKHTKCHSCGSSVPGNGLSVRWFLSYTCCDACGRLFVKGNYCPVCLKVYRDSESTPMVCCDICQRWVHCPCDGISDAKYMQFQVDGNLQYVCPTCRGECCQVQNLEEAVQELWKRKDEEDKDLITSLRAAAGLPTQEEIFNISPFSDDEESGPLLKNDNGRSLKFPLNSLGDKSPRKGKEHGKKSSKKSSKKKGNGPVSVGASDTRIPGESASVTGSATEDVAVNEAGVSKRKYVDEVAPTNVTKTRTIRIKSNKFHGATNSEETGTNTVVSKAAGPKLVIHLGSRSKNTTPSALSNGGTEDTGQLKRNDTMPDGGAKFGNQRGHVVDHADQVKGEGSKSREKERRVIKLKNANSELSNVSSTPLGGEFTHSVLGKRGAEERLSARTGSEGPSSRRHKSSFMKDESGLDDYSNAASSKDHRPYLKFKIPKNTNSASQNVTSNPNTGNSNPVKDEITYSRGQRSKRRRPDDDATQWSEESTINDLTDANWILQKLGKDAAGKRVEIRQQIDNSWHRGTVVEVLKGTSTVSIALDDGTTQSFELGKQAIRFVSQKQKH